jgi:hypothetical protein
MPRQMSAFEPKSVIGESEKTGTGLACPRYCLSNPNDLGDGLRI